jgi:hypothetical protein
VAEGTELDRLLDSVVQEKSPEEIFGSSGLIQELTKRVMERALEAELSEHLGYPKHGARRASTPNARNARPPRGAGVAPRAAAPRGPRRAASGTASGTAGRPTWRARRARRSSVSWTAGSWTIRWMVRWETPIWRAVSFVDSPERSRA